MELTLSSSEPEHFGHVRSEESEISGLQEELFQKFVIHFLQLRPVGQHSLVPNSSADWATRG